MSSGDEKQVKRIPTDKTSMTQSLAQKVNLYFSVRLLEVINYNVRSS